MKFLLEVNVDDKEAIVKKAVKFGTSAHVVVPQSWLGQTVEVRKVEIKNKEKE